LKAQRKERKEQAAAGAWGDLTMLEQRAAYGNHLGRAAIYPLPAER